MESLYHPLMEIAGNMGFEMGWGGFYRQVSMLDTFIRYAESGHSINYIDVHYTYDYIIGETVYPSYVSSKLFFYQQSDKKFRRLRDPHPALEDVNIFEEAKYRTRFWRNNPMVKRTEEEEKIISVFEKGNAFGSFLKGER